MRLQLVVDGVVWITTKRFKHESQLVERENNWIRLYAEQYKGRVIIKRI